MTNEQMHRKPKAKTNQSISGVLPDSELEKENIMLAMLSFIFKNMLICICGSF
jgi:hypothetical protein